MPVIAGMGLHALACLAASGPAGRDLGQRLADKRADLLDLQQEPAVPYSDDTMSSAFLEVTGAARD
jgi:hypothetical protein